MLRSQLEEAVKARHAGQPDARLAAAQAECARLRDLAQTLEYDLNKARAQPHASQLRAIQAKVEELQARSETRERQHQEAMRLTEAAHAQERLSLRKQYESKLEVSEVCIVVASRTRWPIVYGAVIFKLLDFPCLLSNFQRKTRKLREFEGELSSVLRGLASLGVQAGVGGGSDSSSMQAVAGSTSEDWQHSLPPHLQKHLI